MKMYLTGGAVLLAFAPALAQVAPAPAPAPAIQRPAVAAKAHTRAEVQARVAEGFARLDSNRDGFVTREEAQAARQRLRQQRAQRGGERRAQAFERLDSNRDGTVSRNEFEAGRAQRVARRGEAGERRAPRAGRGGFGMGGFGGRMFDMADANRDSRVSLQEATAAALRSFDMADANRDGQVTREERMQMRQRIRSERAPG